MFTLFPRSQRQLDTDIVVQAAQLAASNRFPTVQQDYDLWDGVTRARQHSLSRAQANALTARLSQLAATGA